MSQNSIKLGWGPTDTVTLKDLSRHAMVVGSSGSGKTGVLVNMIEELALMGGRAIVFDTKGDLVNLVPTFSDKATVIVPKDPTGDNYSIRLIDDTASIHEYTKQVLRYLKEKTDEHEYPFIHASSCFKAHGKCLTSLLDPPPSSRAPKAVVDRIERKAEATLEFDKELITLEVGASSNLFEIFTASKANIVVFYLAHLPEEEQAEFQTVLLEKVWEYTRQCGGHDEMHTMVVLDECANLVPPVRNTPTKKVVLTLLKQARAFGVGLVLSTQNPGDVDYKAIANCGTWIIGRMPMAQDRKRLTNGVPELREAAADMAGLNHREFVLVQNGVGKVFESINVLSKLSGPQSLQEVAQMDMLCPLTIEDTAPNKVEKPWWRRILGF